MHSINAGLNSALVVRREACFPLLVLWSLNLNEVSRVEPKTTRRRPFKNKTTPRAESAYYTVWPLLKYLMIFTSRQKCPGVIEPPSIFYWGDGSISRSFPIMG